MGQPQTVQVQRILSEDGVARRQTSMLTEKAELAREVIPVERERLGSALSRLVGRG